MKYLSEFRRHDLAQQLTAAIAAAVRPERQYRLMEFCGGHTHAIYRYGLQHLMPANVEFVHGPGCPVCVLPAGRIDNIIQLLAQHDVILCTYADLMRVPAGGRNTLLKVKAAGADIRMVYSTQDALKIARDNPGRQVVFFAIGFETTAPATAVALQQAQAAGLANFSVFCNHVLTPVAMQAILDTPQPAVIDGILGPSHVSSVIGSAAYSGLAQQYAKPIVIAGFEPLDVLQSVLMLIKQLHQGRAEVENEYTRAVTPAGNSKAQALLSRTFRVRPHFEWRGLGLLADSALAVHEDYAEFDAEQRFAMPAIQAADVKGCECPAILRGQKKPQDCKLLGKACNPENPLGACMVSAEGACAAYWAYARQAA